ncbi:hypothetical protein GCM10022252_28190 [Streptosporangium oxazolinicum]|uniref:DUF2069 domain-containing protein n=2 Tax=Streptosporangium oxazolinicum TaxID=909287 RepID=A0ABP8ATM8_9ACTN
MPTMTTGNAMRIARWTIVALTVVMIYYFVTSNAIRSGNPFLVPDLILTVLLPASAALRGRVAVPAMIFAFAWASAVWTVSLCTYITRGAFADGANHLLLIFSSVLAAGLLAITALGHGDRERGEGVRGRV